MVQEPTLIEDAETMAEWIIGTQDPWARDSDESTRRWKEWEKARGAARRTLERKSRAESENAA